MFLSLYPFMDWVKKGKFSLSFLQGNQNWKISPYALPMNFFFLFFQVASFPLTNSGLELKIKFKFSFRQTTFQIYIRDMRAKAPKQSMLKNLAHMTSYLTQRNLAHKTRCPTLTAYAVRYLDRDTKSRKHNNPSDPLNSSRDRKPTPTPNEISHQTPNQA